MRVQLFVVVDAVQWRHRTVVVCQSQEAARRVLVDVLLVAVLVDQFALGRLAQQVVARALVCGALFHGDDRIEQYLEVRCCLSCSMGSHRRSQVSACREAHDAYIVRIDVPLLGMPANQSDSLFGILCRNGIVTVGHAVFQHDEGNALSVEERSPVEAFVLHGQMLVATTGAAHHGTPCGFLLVRQKDGHLRHVVRVAVIGTWALRPQIHLRTLLGKSQHGYHHQQEK